MAQIDWRHDGLEVQLWRLGAMPWLSFWIAVTVLGVAAFVLGALTPMKTAVIPGAIVALGAAIKAFSAYRTRRATISCDGRTITFDDGGQRSLLDIKRVGGKQGRLWFDTELGPLQPFSVGPYYESDTDLAKVADLLNTAIEQAQHRRGEAPDKMFFKMKQVLGQTE
mgnify:CR=1 FL=1